MTPVIIEVTIDNTTVALVGTTINVGGSYYCLQIDDKFFGCGLSNSTPPSMPGLGTYFEVAQTRIRAALTEQLKDPKKVNDFLTSLGHKFAN